MPSPIHNMNIFIVEIKSSGAHHRLSSNTAKHQGVGRVKPHSVVPQLGMRLVVYPRASYWHIVVRGEVLMGEKNLVKPQLFASCPYCVALG